MSDQHLRTLERTSRAHDARLLRARLRVGRTDPAWIALAAAFGDPHACAALHRPSPPTPPSHPPAEGWPAWIKASAWDEVLSVYTIQAWLAPWGAEAAQHALRALLEAYPLAEVPVPVAVSIPAQRAQSLVVEPDPDPRETAQTFVRLAMILARHLEPPAEPAPASSPALAGLLLVHRAVGRVLAPWALAQSQPPREPVDLGVFEWHGKLRRGQLSQDRLILAAFLGSAPARWLAHPFAPEPPDDLWTWVECLDRWGARLLLQTALVAARLALPRWERQPSAVGASAPRRALDLAERAVATSVRPQDLRLAAQAAFAAAQRSEGPAAWAAEAAALAAACAPLDLPLAHQTELTARAVVRAADALPNLNLRPKLEEALLAWVEQ